MIIINNGMYRSGSTLSYNVIRRILEIKGLGGAYGTAEAKYATTGVGRLYHNEHDGSPTRDTRGYGLAHLIRKTNGKLWVVIKVHKFNAVDLRGFGGHKAKAVLTYRHPMDIAGSLCRMFGMPYPKAGGLLQPILEDVALYFAQKDHFDVLTLKYERYYNQIASMAIRIAEFLGIELTDGEAEQIAEDCDPKTLRKLCEGLDKDAADGRTQLRGNHISPEGGEPDTYRHLIDEHTQQLIKECFAGYYESAGYK